MVSFSAVIITFNEEKNIARCLESLKTVVDEIIVLDSFSSDATESICSKYQVRFVQRAWEGYSASKNYANSLASHKWILSLDADEALSDKLKEELLRMKSKGEIQASSFNRMTNYCGTWIKHSGWYPDVKIRLFNRDTTEWAGTLHEELKFKAPEPIRHIDRDVLHYSYYTLDDHLKQIEKFTSIAAKEYFDAGKCPPLYKQYLNAWAKFVSHYLIHAGFLDGAAGFKIARYSAFATYLKYKKARALFES